MYTKELAIGFWDNSVKAVGEYKEFDIKSKTIRESDIRESVRHAFRDLTVRTMKKVKEKQGEAVSLDGLAKSSCDKDDGLLMRYNVWFQKDPTQDEFDAWHQETCGWVVGFLKDYYASEDCTCGKAQKIVNMSFKNLYALCVKKGIEEHYSKHFYHCHVPLDSFTLEWFQRECVKWKMKLIKGHVPNWSAIRAYGDRDNDEYTTADSKKFYTYFYFQKMFRKWFFDEAMTPLKAEFVFWPRIQKELAAEAFLFSLKENISSKEKEVIKRLPLEDKRKIIKDELNKIPF